MNRLLFFLWLLTCVILLQRNLAAEVLFNQDIPQVTFAAAELREAMAETGREDVSVKIAIESDPSSPEAFQIRSMSESNIQVIGTDANGAMYGGIEVAEHLKLGLPIESVSRSPFVKKRGIKSNLPLDVRAPSYCDKGTAAQLNIDTSIWDYDGFWVPYLDTLARYRYNVLSLWTTHPYTHLVKVSGYEDASLDDVFRLKEEFLKPGISNKFEDMDKNHDGALTAEDGTIELVKNLTIDEKIEHWKKVFQHAEDRGIDIYVFSWTVFVGEAKNHYGITEDQTNPTTIDYVRKCVEEALLTYPQIKGIGVTSGENDRRELDGSPDSTEWFIRKTYAQAVENAQQDPRWVDRDIRFIFRRHGSEHEWVDEVVDGYQGGIVDTSVKYAVAHMYSSRRPQEWESRMVRDGWLDNYKVWLNLRNDDLFMHRFGSPDFLRELIRNMPHEHIRGFYAGSDGYYWGKEFISKRPDLSGQLEIQKHWYNFRMLGEMSYNVDLDDEYWESVLKHHFPSVDADLLFHAWEQVSEVIPQVNRAVWAATDGSFAPEMCQQGSGFLKIDDYYFARPPMKLRADPPAGEQHCVSAEDWAKRFASGKNASFGNKLTPLEVAEKLDGYAEAALEALPTLEQQASDDVQLRDVLLDIKSMAYLGQYYADKQRSAAHLMVFRLSGWRDIDQHQQAVSHIKRARDHWQAYADVLDSHYKTSLHAKTTWFDWYDRLKDVETEVAAVEGEGALPEIKFTGIAGGANFQVGHSLDVGVKVSAESGLDDIRLLLNGVRVGKPVSKSSFTWTASEFSELADLREDWYSLKVIAVDAKGFVVDKEIYVSVGSDPGEKEDWILEPYAVLMTDGQELLAGRGETDEQMEDDELERNIDGIDVKFQFDHEGKLVVRDMFYRVALIRTYSKAGKVGNGPRRAEFKDGVLSTYTLVDPASMLWSSRNYDRTTRELRRPAPKDQGFQGPFDFVITRGKHLAIYGTRNDSPALVWSQGLDWKFWNGRFEK